MGVGSGEEVIEGGEVGGGGEVYVGSGGWGQRESENKINP